MSEFASETFVTLGFDCINRPETDMFITYGFAVRSDQRLVIYGDSPITRVIEGESPVLKQISAESPVIKAIEGDSCLLRQIDAESIVIKTIEGDSEIELRNQYLT